MLASTGQLRASGPRISVPTLDVHCHLPNTYGWAFTEGHPRASQGSVDHFHMKLKAPFLEKFHSGLVRREPDNKELPCKPAHHTLPTALQMDPHSNPQLLGGPF